MDKRRIKFLKEKRNQNKRLFDQESNKIYIIFLISILFGLANWLFWQEQFLNLDYKYYILFEIIPIGLGIVYFNLKFKQFFNYSLKSKFSIYTIILYMFYGVFSLMLSYASFGTTSNVIFKSLMHYSTSDVKSKIEKYKIIKFYNPKNYKRKRRESRRFYFQKNFYIDYQASQNQEERIKIPTYDSKNNYLLDVKDEVVNKTFVLETKKGFWNIKKVLDVSVEWATYHN